MQSSYLPRKHKVVGYIIMIIMYLYPGICIYADTVVL